MTQFILVIGKPPQDPGFIFRSIRESDEFLKQIAYKLFTDKQLEFCWQLEGDLIHALFSQAQTQIFEGNKIQQTIVGQLLVTLFRSCQETVLWYGNDFHDLTEFVNIETTLDEIASELVRSSGEIYLRFRNKEIELIHLN